MVQANQADFLGGGGTLANPMGRPAFDQDPLAVALASQKQNAAITQAAADRTNIANAPYVRGVRNDPGYAPLDQLSASLNGNIGGVSGAYNTGRAAIGTPAEANLAQATPQNAAQIAASRGMPVPPPGPTPLTAAQQAAIASNTPPTVQEQIGSARATGAGFLGLANNVMGQTAGQATSLFGQGQGYSVSAPQITSGGTYNTPTSGQPMQGAPTQGLAQGPGGVPLPGGSSLPSSAGAGGGPHIVPGANPNGTYSMGPQGAAPGSGAPGMQGGGQPQQAQQPAFQVGARGAGPSMVDPGSLSGVQNIAGSLGSAPSVDRGNVGMVQNGAAPGAVAGQLGSMGASNADQQGMLGRVNSFLDAPEGPSVAQAQLQQSQAGNMADLIGAARSGRGGAGSQAQALRGAISAGSAVMSDTAGQAATLRAQEQDMLKNRQLNAIGLGGQMATAARGQDISYRGQDLSALQGDQSTALGARGQDLQGSIANQGAQLGLEQLSGQLALGARGQDLSALQSDQGAQLGTRAQDLSALQGNQGAQLGARGQDVTARGQDLGALQGDQNAQLAAQQLALQGQMGLTGLGLQAQGQGLQYSQSANALGLGAEGMAQDAANQANNRAVQLSLGNQSNDTALQMQQNTLNARPSYGQQLLGNVLGTGLQVGGAVLGGVFGGPAGAAGGAAAGKAVGSIFQPNAAAATATPPPNYYTVPYAGTSQYNANNYNPGPQGGASGAY
jgi:hypothetical protein